MVARYIKSPLTARQAIRRGEWFAETDRISLQQLPDVHSNQADIIVEYLC